MRTLVKELQTYIFPTRGPNPYARSTPLLPRRGPVRGWGGVGTQRREDVTHDGEGGPDPRRRDLQGAPVGPPTEEMVQTTDPEATRLHPSQMCTSLRGTTRPSTTS